MGLLVASIYWFSGMSAFVGVVILGSLFLGSVLIETARLRIPTFNKQVLRVMGPFMRAHEANAPSALPHYILSSLICVGIFPQPIAVLSILYLAVGDPTASLFGILFGHRSIRFSNGKSLVGTLAGIGVCFLVGLLFLLSLGFPLSSVFVLSVVGALAGGLAEHLPMELDDNLSIPVISGFVLWLGFILFGL